MDWITILGVGTLAVVVALVVRLVRHEIRDLRNRYDE